MAELVTSLAAARTGHVACRSSRHRIEKATARQINEVSHQITHGDFMATHWLVSFALQAVLV
ncbi:hypothetical protein JCM18916_1144 [Cutibacterium acnes JCM 18916]|nr:hypothetical protein JCM18916_1144 [Cutibacterium acnes JCM 18916]GAE77811.1 hypothetical protein JCM18918_3727 [Cutibacterium acnes JCM 18918]